MKKKIKKYLVLLFAFGLCLIEGSRFLSIAGTASAAGNAKTFVSDNGVVSVGQGQGIITIEGKSGLSVKDRLFYIYKLLDCEKSDDGSSVSYTLNSSYRDIMKNIVIEKYKAEGKNFTPDEMKDEVIVDYIASISNKPFEKADSEYRKFIEEVRNSLRNGAEHDISVQVKGTDSQGKCVINGLDYGYYIVDEVTDNKDKNTASSLCMVTTADPEATIKLKADYPSVIKKIQEDDTCPHIKDNEGWNDIGDFEIGQTIPYKFVSTVPDMTGYDTYYYCWHDKMNPCLDYNEYSFSIIINGESSSGKSMSYKLKNNEFSVKDAGMEGETFVVEITDLKEIVDREFNKGAEEKKYGQNITLRFNGVLKDDAGLKTGRPGFENDVCLEFSNDADSDGKGSTGKTPWDTVVCFTFKLNINKTNENGARLQDAAFKLYRDEECRYEVYLSKVNDTYIVLNNDSMPRASSAEMVSDVNGEIHVAGLDGGTYYLKETKAPKGYSLLTKPIAVNLVPSYTTERDSYVKGDGSTENTLVKLSGTAHIETLFHGVFNKNEIDLTGSASNGELNMDVVNKTGKHLPRTGTSAGMLLFGCGTVIMIASLVIKNKRKADK